MQYQCSNCGDTFEYWTRSKQTSEYHFCSRDCKQEYHYLLNDLSISQWNLLDHLVRGNGYGKFSPCMTVNSLVYRIAPLIDVVHRLPDSAGIYVKINETGRRWHIIKAAEYG